MNAGGEVLIVSQGKPVGRLVAPPAPTGVPVLGRGKGKLVSYVEDKEHLKDFESYMP